MKTIIAYLMAFTMLASITTQAILPALAASEGEVVSSSVVLTDSESADQEQVTLPLLDAVTSDADSNSSSASDVQVEEESQPVASQPEATSESQPESDSADASQPASSEAESQVEPQEPASSEAESTSDSAVDSTVASSQPVSEAVDSVASESASDSSSVSESSSASEEVSSQPDSDSTSEVQEEEPEENVEEMVVLGDNTAGVELLVQSAMTMGRDVTFTMQVYKDGVPVAEAVQGILSANAQSAEGEQLHLKTGSLEPGSYKVVVSAPGFATYTQEVVLETGTYSRVTVYTGAVQFEGDVHGGMLRLGDVNQDGVLDSQDVDAVIAGVASGAVQADLNGDGEVNLVDVQYLASNLQGKEEQQKDEVYSSVEKRVANEVIKPTVAEGTNMTEGSVEELLNQQGTVVLQPVDEQPISEANPVEVTFNFAENTNNGTQAKMDGITIDSGSGSGNGISEGVITVELEDGTTESIPFSEASKARSFSLLSLFRSTPTVSVVDGKVEVNFGKQVAVKKITLTITKTQSNNLAEISKVEFVNGMDERIPEPEMDIPTDLATQVGDKEIRLSWKAAANVTGYEVEVVGAIKKGAAPITVVIRSSTNSLTITQLNNEMLVNGEDYTIRVRSVNGSWKSPYSDAIVASPIVTKLPDAPDNLEATGGYKHIQLSWKDMKDTDSYTVLYRKKTEGGDYIQAVTGLATNSYRLENLEDATEYEVVVYGTNDLGDGPHSIPSIAKTVSLLEAKLPNYLTLNKPGKVGELTSHIKDAYRIGEAGGSAMIDSPLDAGDAVSALGLFDNDQGTYYYSPDWDFGVSYHAGSWGIQVEFDQVLQLGGFSFAEPTNGNILGTKVYYWDASGNRVELAKEDYTISIKMDENNRRFGYVSFHRQVDTSKVLLGFSNLYNIRGMKIGEIRFFGYNSIREDIMGLYEDQYHTTIRSDVTQEQLDELSVRLETPDAESGEKHPNYTQLRRELDTAIALFKNAAALSEVQHIEAMGPNVSGYADGKLGFTGLNPWQPLGIVAAAGEEVTIYVGNPDMQVGANTDLYLVATQHNAESGSFMKQVARLKVGANTVTIPAIVSKDFEKGGSLYVYYAGQSTESKYGVRVEGGNRIPMLDLYKVEDAAERLALATAYVQELEAYVAKLEQEHAEHHQNSSNANVHYDYNQQECILGATEIMADTMLYSLSAKQVLAGLGTGTTEEKAQNLVNSVQAMDDLMLLFYQHKGLTEDAPSAINRVPSQHLNIRFMRMFAGAFMYASGNHIGIAWGSIPGVVSGQPLVADDMGNFISGSLFGWGIGHEIGHDINQGAYAVAEITNNYFAQLATYGTSGTRFKYDAIYDKVTSGVLGRDPNVATQLGMYWQLRLAYDNYFTYKTFNTYDEVVSNLFFARVDTYARTPAAAPVAAENGVALTLSNVSDQNLMRLASAAAQKDLTEFFTRWGMEIDAETAAYMSQWPAETRAIFYINDDAQAFRINNPSAETFTGKQVVTKDQVTVTQGGLQNGLAQNQVKLDIKGTASSSLLGYEINRVMISGGQREVQNVGFVLANADGSASFTDTVNTINNRVFSYQVVAIDQFTNRSAVLELDAVKVSHDGSHKKSTWTVTTNMVSTQDTVVVPDAENPDNGFNPGANNQPTVVSAIDLIVDNNLGTTFVGTANGKQPTIEINFGKELSVTGFKFTLAAGQTLPQGEFAVQLLENGEWTAVSTEVNRIESTGASTVYFTTEDGWLRTSGATAMRLVFLTDTTVSITELDVLGPTGDNVEIFADGIGILSEDYVYSTEGDTIPAGSIVFTGSYKGNPAFNAVILYDQDGKIVGYDENGVGESNQIILAPVPEEGDLANTSDGRWVYWIDADAVKPEKVRVELYRVDDAQTNNGQRLVSDSLWATLPAELPELTITANS